MNILPHKSWHVRTKDNIARVRKDEAQAAELEKEIERRSKLAEQEARTAFLRHRARQDDDEIIEPTEPAKVDNHASIYNEKGNINFFQDAESGKQTTGTNKDYEQEKKDEKEKYEKDIGLLTYLGQNSLELQGSKAWFENEDNRLCRLEGDDELDLKSKNKLDPIGMMIKYSGHKIYKQKDQLKCTASEVSSTNESKISLDKDLKKNKRFKHDKDKDTNSKRKQKQSHHHRKSKKRKYQTISDDEKSKSKRHKHSKRKKAKKDKITSGKHISSDTNDESDTENEQEKAEIMEKMRTERLKREEIEKKRVEKLLAGKHPDEKEPVLPSVPHQKYNNQFNPHLARQNRESKNKLQPGVKYWLQ